MCVCVCVCVCHMLLNESALCSLERLCFATVEDFLSKQKIIIIKNSRFGDCCAFTLSVWAQFVSVRDFVCAFVIVRCKHTHTIYVMCVVV